VAVWRELRRSGALHLQQSVVVVPEDEAFAGVVERLREVLAELDEEEAEFDDLQREVHGAPGAEAAGRALRQAEEALARYSAAVFERTQP
jgi:hypothetical protein